MSRAKLVVAACLAVIVLGALPVATAVAGEWDVGGTKLVGSAAIKSPASVKEHGKFTVPGSGVTVECTSPEAVIEGGEIVAPDEIRVKSMSFKECKTSGGNCELEEAALKTLALHGLAELDGTLGTFAKILPLPSKTIAAIHFLGSSCALLGVQPLTGTFDFLAPSGRDPAVSQLINTFSLKGGLKLGSEEAELVGVRCEIRLVIGATWNFL